MRKWTYLVAALLMSGATATFTGCVDTDEPAGIEQLRGAKAALLQAKAEYESARAQEQLMMAEKQNIENQKEQVNLQILQLGLAMKEAQNQWAMDSLQARRDTLAASLEIMLVEFQEEKAEADYELQKAMERIDAALITMKDDIYAQKISYYRALLNGGQYINETGTLTSIGGTGAATDLATAETELFQMEQNRAKFVAQNTYYQANLEAQLAQQQKSLEIQQGLRDDLDELQGADVAELNTQLAAKRNEQQALDTKEADAIKELEAMRAELQPTAEQIAELDVQKQAKKTYTIAVADIADAAMYNTLYAALNGFSYTNVDKTGINYVFEQDAMTGDYTMKNDFTLFGSGYSLDNEPTILSRLASSIKNEYEDDFATAYSSLFSYTPASGLFNTDGSLKDNVLAKVNNELSRLEIDLPNLKAAATADSTAWVNAYAAYQDALVAYGGYKGTATWDAINAEIKAYIDLPATTTAAAKAAAAEALRQAIITYLNNREAVDGFECQIDFAETYKTAFVATTDLTTFDTDMNNFYNNSSYLGSSTISTSKSNNENSKLDAFLTATEKLLGGSYGNLADAVQPEAYKDGDATKYRMPAGYEATNGSYGRYQTASEADVIFTTINDWIALYQGIEADRKASADAVADIDAKVDELKIAAMDQYSALWAAEVECYLIKGTNTSRLSEIWSNGNPYRTIYTTASILSEYEAIQQEINYINSAITGGGTFDYVYYDPATNEYKIGNGTLDYAIADLDSKIENIQDDIVETQTLIDLYKEFGFSGTMGTTLDENNCLELMDKNIAEKQAEIEGLQAEVDRITATMEKLLDAYAAE